MTSWLLVRLSLADVESLARVGAVENERFTERARDLYFVLWTWSSERLHGESGRQQDNYVARFGHKRLLKRIERCNRFISQLVSSNQ